MDDDCNDGDHSCVHCGVSFRFKSLLHKHNKSTSHRMFVEAMKQPIELEAFQTDYPSMDRAYDEGTDPDAQGTSPSDDEDDLTSESDFENEFDAWMDDMELQMHDKEDYYPFPSKIFALLFFLVHGPHPLGSRTLLFVWFILKQSGITVPSITSVRSFTLPRLEMPKKHISSCGNPFYCQSVVSTLQHCMANPKVASSLARYPVWTDGAVEELFHGSVWHDDERFQAPMTTLSNGEQLFVRDCVTFEHHTLGVTKAIILKLFEKSVNHELYAEVDLLLNCYQYQYVAQITDCYLPDDCYVIYETQVIPVSAIICTITKPSSVIKWTETRIQRFSTEEIEQYFAPNDWKEKAGGKKVVMVPLVLFTDDTSGNRSKKWNKFESWYLTLAGLGRHANAQPRNIHFLTTSNKVCPLEQCVPIVEELQQLETEGIVAFDALSGCEVLVVAPLLCVVCDNPRARELCNQLGSTTRKYCRMCMADKIDSPDSIGICRTRELSLSQMEEVMSQTSISSKHKIRKKYGIKENYNPMLHIKADIYKSTPLEPLHVFLLGASKYLLQIFMPLLSDMQKTEILARISAFNMSGFTTKMYGNVCYYFQSFVGRDFKAWSQMAIFILSSYLDAGNKEVLLNYSKVFAIAYAKVYHCHEKDQLQDVCQKFINVVKLHQPDLLKRPKIHLILHLVDCLAQYGSTSAFSAERFESFNSNVRTQNIYSNRQAPSRDIAKHFAVLQHVMHIIDGGCYDQENSCGEALRRLCSAKPIQSFLYQTSLKDIATTEGIYKPGTPRQVVTGCLSVGVLRVTVPGDDTCTLSDLAKTDPPFELSICHLQFDDKVTPYRGIVAQSLQLVHVGDYVELDGTCEVKFGLLLSVCRSSLGVALCVLQVFEPLLTQAGEPLLGPADCALFELSHIIQSVEGSKVLRAVSFVHECSSGCHFEEMVTSISVEREKVGVNRIVFVHDFTNNLYCYNNYCINA